MPDERHDYSELRITLRDVYVQVQEQNILLHKMSSDIKRSLDSHDRVKETVEDHENRIRTMERKIWQASGIASFVGVAGGVFVNMLVK